MDERAGRSGSVTSNGVEVFPLPPVPGAAASVGSDGSGGSDPGEVPSTNECRTLARKGKWKEVVSRLGKFAETWTNETRGEGLALAAYHAISLLKLREYRALAERMGAFQDLMVTETNCDEAVEPLAPFALHWVYAQHPIYLGQATVGLDRLYLLLRKASVLEGHYEAICSRGGAGGGGDIPPPPVSDVEPLDAGEADAGAVKLWHAWRRRRHMLACALAGHHAHLKQFRAALDVMGSYARDAGERDDPDVVAMLACILLKMGDVPSSRRALAVLKRQLEQCPGDKHLASLCANLEGLVSFASEGFDEAIEKFKVAAQLAPDGQVPVNNLSVALMYARKLHASIKALEQNLSSNRLSLLHPPIVLNLCSMYELVSSKSFDSKGALRNWIAQHASDEFDPRNMRMAG